MVGTGSPTGRPDGQYGVLDMHNPGPAKKHKVVAFRIDLQINMEHADSRHSLAPWYDVLMHTSQTQDVRASSLMGTNQVLDAILAAAQFILPSDWEEYKEAYLLEVNINDRHVVWVKP